MSRLPILTAKELIKTLKKIGFEIIRQRGSHVFLAHEDGRTTIIPVHPGEDIR
jgi:predicted RNA binding protein YcfA (HicA-like mRNA interferase family)